MKITEFTTSFPEPVEIIAARLIENLHLRWYYCVFHVDEYTDEQDRTIYTIYGLYNGGQSNTTPYFLIVWLTQLDKDQTQFKLEYGTANTHGYPMQTMNWFDSREYSPEPTAVHPLSDDIIKFCRVPHGEGSGMVDWLRRAVDRLLPGTTSKGKRRYHPGRKSS
jgi:hypothetical protein